MIFLTYMKVNFNYIYIYIYYFYNYIYICYYWVLCNNYNRFHGFHIIKEDNIIQLACTQRFSIIWHPSLYREGKFYETVSLLFRAG